MKECIGVALPTALPLPLQIPPPSGWWGDLQGKAASDWNSPPSAWWGDLQGKTLIKWIDLYRDMEKLVFPKIEDLVEFYLSKLTFYRNLSGPYGPYEPLLWDISPNKWPKNRVFDPNWLFWKMAMFIFLGKAIFGQKKAPAGCPDSKTKVVNMFRHIPDPNYI